ncbi:hypothetical protein KEM56_003438 [Ascosphaera pollenicola]|nr:hypothetical protein KEM56_003438 [Ascosphaera pollenicola]
MSLCRIPMELFLIITQDLSVQDIARLGITNRLNTERCLEAMIDAATKYDTRVQLPYQLMKAARHAALTGRTYIFQRLLERTTVLNADFGQWLRHLNFWPQTGDILEFLMGYRGNCCEFRRHFGYCNRPRNLLSFVVEALPETAHTAFVLRSLIQRGAEYWIKGNMGPLALAAELGFSAKVSILMAMFEWPYREQTCEELRNALQLAVLQNHESIVGVILSSCRLHFEGVLMQYAQVHSFTNWFLHARFVYPLPFFTTTDHSLLHMALYHRNAMMVEYLTTYLRMSDEQMLRAVLYAMDLNDHRCIAALIRSDVVFNHRAAARLMNYQDLDRLRYWMNAEIYLGKPRKLMKFLRFTWNPEATDMFLDQIPIREWLPFGRYLTIFDYLYIQRAPRHHMPATYRRMRLEQKNEQIHRIARQMVRYNDRLFRWAIEQNRTIACNCTGHEMVKKGHWDILNAILKAAPPCIAFVECDNVKGSLLFCLAENWMKCPEPRRTLKALLRYHPGIYDSHDFEIGCTATAKLLSVLADDHDEKDVAVQARIDEGISALDLLKRRNAFMSFGTRDN